VPDLNLEMAYIRPGTFTMGSENGDSDEKPLTRVTLTKGYWLGKTEVTQGQYEALMGANPSNFKNAGRDAPVEQVSWDEAMQFCRKLTERERQAGRLPDGYEYTLPTEAQWEYACRAGTTADYAGNLDAMAWYNQNSGNTTHPVAQKQANAWGLYDMHGNVWEWCRDWYGNYQGGSVTDPTGPTSGSFRVYRGGGWDLDAGCCRSAVRFGYVPGGRGDDLGFRLALGSVL
jgi:formylglycine-generating enzyme required for sulfatase activity